MVVEYLFRRDRESVLSPGALTLLRVSMRILHIAYMLTLFPGRYGQRVHSGRNMRRTGLT